MPLHLHHIPSRLSQAGWPRPRGVEASVAVARRTSRPPPALSAPPPAERCGGGPAPAPSSLRAPRASGRTAAGAPGDVWLTSPHRVRPSTWLTAGAKTRGVLVVVVVVVVVVVLTVCYTKMSVHDRALVHLIMAMSLWTWPKNSARPSCLDVPPLPGNTGSQTPECSRHCTISSNEPRRAKAQSVPTKP